MDYIRFRQYCCLPNGQADPRCIPITVPEDDPYLKVTDIRCLNFTRAQTFQDVGCLPKTLPPEQVSRAKSENCCRALRTFQGNVMRNSNCFAALPICTMEMEQKYDIFS